MGYVRMGVPQGLVLKLAAASRAEVLVETGTFRGATTRWAAGHFKKVITIEINPELSATVAQKPDCPKNIEFVVGDSRAMLPRIAAKLDGPAVFWLDGHYCGPGSGDEDDECPIMEELDAIKGCRDSIVLIDDARCFLGPPPPPHKPEKWVAIDAIFRFFADNMPSHLVTIHDDVIIAIPARLKSILDQDWSENYSKRFPVFPGHPPSLLRRLLSKNL